MTITIIRPQIDLMEIPLLDMRLLKKSLLFDKLKMTKKNKLNVQKMMYKAIF
jgi:hypothetical protein